MAQIFRRISTRTAAEDAAPVAERFPRLATLVTQLLARDPERRLSDAGEIALQLVIEEGRLRAAEIGGSAVVVAEGEIRI